MAPTLYDVTMRRQPIIRALSCVTAVLVMCLATACDGGGSSSTTTATPPPTAASHKPTPTPAPDTEQVDVVSVGVGAYMLQAIPVALLHNRATRHTATGVATHFTVRGMTLDAPVVALGPGETLAVAALCTDTCNGAGSTTAAVTVASWSTALRTPLSVSGGGYSCSGGCGGHQNGDVTGTVAGSVSAGSIIVATAVCMNSAGSIIGGGSGEQTWGGGGSMAIDVSVLVSGDPARCQLYATAT